MRRQEKKRSRPRETTDKRNGPTGDSDNGVIRHKL